MKTVTCSQSELNRIRADAAYMGYSTLSAEEKAIADAFDAGTLRVLKPSMLANAQAAYLAKRRTN